MHRLRYPLSALALVVLAACALAGPAGAHGDPASDYLLVKQVFTPYGLKAPPGDRARLNELVAAANSAGYPLRVAVIPTRASLGTEPSFWARPRAYARSLAVEIQADLRALPVLVVMPSGLGFGWAGHSAAGADAALASVRVQPGDAGLVRTATAAATRLLAEQHVHVSRSASASPASRTTRDRLVILIVAGFLLALGLLVRSLVAWRRSR